MSHLTIAEIRLRRTERRVQAFASELNRLNWERRELHEEYVRVSTIYARHLERIKVKAMKNNTAIRALNARVAEYADSAGAPVGQDSCPAVTQET